MLVYVASMTRVYDNLMMGEIGKKNTKTTSNQLSLTSVFV